MLEHCRRKGHDFSRMMTVRVGLMVCACLVLSGCKSSTSSLSYKLVETREHDVTCYTQGLEFLGERLFESGGGYGDSVVRELNPMTGEVLRQREFPESLFAEGLTILNGQLWLLTWQAGKVFVMDVETFELKRSYAFQGEGWGLTNDGELLIMSDGSSTVELRNPSDFSVVRSMEVTEGGKSVVDLNELEWADGHVYANIYQSNRIVRFSLKDGEVKGSLDLTELAKNHPEMDELQVLNGIAYQKATGHFWVTGKNWPKIYELKISAR